MTDRIALKFPCSLFPEHIIRRAQQDYEHICTIDVSLESGAFVCTLTKSVTNLKLTSMEFSNYLIELSNVWTRHEHM